MTSATLVCIPVSLQRYGRQNGEGVNVSLENQDLRTTLFFSEGREEWHGERGHSFWILDPRIPGENVPCGQVDFIETGKAGTACIPADERRKSEYMMKNMT